MPEEYAVAESVTSTDVPVAVDPAQLTKPVHPPSQPQVGGADPELLQHKLGLANSHAKQAKKEAEEARQQMLQLQQELESIKTAQQSALQKGLEEQGQYKQLWEDLKKNLQGKEQEIADLKSSLESVTQNAQQEKLRASSISLINQAGALNSQQMYTLLQPTLRQDESGNPVVLNGGVEQPLSDYLSNLRQASEWQHHFNANAASGMGSTSVGTVAPGRNNPYVTGNLTEALRLEVENPDLAKAMKAEAKRG